jgi:hypothetical protein
MFDTWQNLDLLHKKLDDKNMLSYGRKIFETSIDGMAIMVRIGLNNSTTSQKHIHENQFYLGKFDKPNSSANYDDNIEFVEFVKTLQELELFDEFKFRLEEKLLTDV